MGRVLDKSVSCRCDLSPLSLWVHMGSIPCKNPGVQKNAPLTALLHYEPTIRLLTHQSFPKIARSGKMGLRRPPVKVSRHTTSQHTKILKCRKTHPLPVVLSAIQ